MIIRFILFALGIYFIYKFIFELVVPIFRTTQKVRQQFGAMQQHMQDQMKNPQNGNAGQTRPSSTEKSQPSVRAGDYIDFEEVK